MPAEIQTGTALLHGITNDGTAFTIDAFATFIPETADLTHKFERTDEKDNTGYDVTLLARNGNVEGRLTLKPSGATRAAAATVAVFLTPLAKVVLAHFKLAALNGNWVYIGDQQIQLNFDQPAKITLPVRKYDDATQNTSLTTTVVG